MIKICGNCNREFECNDKPTKRGSRSNLRKRCGARNCSTKCSREYWDRCRRDYQKEYQKLHRKVCKSKISLNKKNSK